MSKVLIVEDNPVVVQVLTNLLETNNYSVVVAGDGEEGLRKTEAEKPNLIILDVMMPKMTGYQFFNELKKKSDELRKIPVIVMSAKESMRNFFDIWEIVDFMPKPFDSDLLLEKIKAVLNIESIPLAKPPTGHVKSSTAGQGKKVMILAVQDFFYERMKGVFEKQKFSVVRALNAEDAVKTARGQSPSLIICEFWEEPSVLDAVGISKSLKAESDLKSIPLYVFTSGANWVTAAQQFSKSVLIDYKDSYDLMAKLEVLADSLFAMKS